ncbi:MAG: methyltransferase domain-containing protein [Planctomycetota bacterium]
MHDDHERRTSFGAVAEAYDRHRMPYRAEVYDAIAARSGVDGSSRILELGAGTGIATRALARWGAPITAIEPSAEMASVLRRRAPRHVSTVESRFEDWSDPEPPYDLVAAAQSWHWIEPAAKFERLPALMAPDGVLAVFAHAAVDAFALGQPAYRRWTATSKRGPLPSLDERVASLADPIRAHYRDVRVDRWPWARTFSPEEYVALLSTYSDHSTLPEPNRSNLFAELAEAIREAGGRIERRYETVLVTAARR